MAGLGSGSLAWYVQPSQRMKFYEIDPVVENSTPGKLVHLPEGRQRGSVCHAGGWTSCSGRWADRLFDLIILDAFSSDSAPTHLLTREAFELYLRKLKRGGLLAFNTSNRHINLSSVVVAVAQSLGMQVRVTLPPAPGSPNRQADAEFGQE